jgi:hypothetical protein
MNGLQVIGPIAHKRAAEQQRAQRITTTDTRADQLPCAYCQSGLYPQLPLGPCPACGNEPLHNNGRVLEVRSALRCAVCGVPWAQCWHGYQAGT